MSNFELICAVLLAVGYAISVVVLLTFDARQEHRRARQAVERFSDHLDVMMQHASMPASSTHTINLAVDPRDMATISSSTMRYLEVDLDCPYCRQRMHRHDPTQIIEESRVTRLADQFAEGSTFIYEPVPATHWAVSCRECHATFCMPRDRSAWPSGSEVAS